MATAPSRLDDSRLAAGSHSLPNHRCLPSPYKKDKGVSASIAIDDEIKTPRHPNSDDSISAYIHATSSPVDGQSKARSSASRSTHSTSSADGGIASRTERSASSPLATQGILGGSKTDATFDSELSHHHRPSDGGQEADVAAASGMLNLRASQSTPSSTPASSVRLPWSDTFASPNPRQRSEDVSPFVVHCDEDRKDHDASPPTSFRLLRDGAQHDAVLFSNGSSQSFPSVSQASQGPLQSLPWQTSASVVHGTEENHTDRCFEQDEYQSDTSRLDPTGDASLISETSVSFEQQGTEAEDGTGKKRRRRTKKEEADVLAGIYTKTAFPDSATRQHLADQLGMTTRAVSIWFQNRRQAERKRASRFASSDNATVSPSGAVATSLTRARSDNATSIIGAAAASAPVSKLNRWPPSLDDFACSPLRKSPDSDDGHSTILPRSGMKQAPTGETKETFSTTFEDVGEDKENQPLSATEHTTLSTLCAAIETSRPRQPLKDLRDIVFGNDSLPPQESTEKSLDETPNREPVRSADRAPVSFPATETQSRPPRRALLSRSVSANGVSHNRLSMDQVIRCASTSAIERAQRRRLNMSLKRVKSLSTSQRGRASIDGMASPPRKRPFLRCLSMSTCLTPALARIVSEQCSEQTKSKDKQIHDADTPLVEKFAPQRGEHVDLLGKMSSSSSGLSSDVCHDASIAEVMEEDEEKTLRLAANRRLAKAHAKGEDGLIPKSHALSDLTSRPWARSISGPAVHGRISLPTLDMAAGRDRSEPNSHAATLRIPLDPTSRNETPSDASISSELNKAGRPTAVAGKRKVNKRKPGGESSGRGNKKKGKPNNQGVLLLDEEAENVPPSQHLDASHESNILASVDTPGSRATNKRSFGRSVSAQYDHQATDSHQTPISRAVAHPSLLYASTPLPSSMTNRYQHHAPSSSLGRRSGSVTAPSLSADAGSGGREMTPRSLAFSLGLTHTGHYGGGGIGVHQTPYGGALQTPFGGRSVGSSVYGSRYLPSSSRDLRGSQASGDKGHQKSASTWSPLAKGRSDASMIGSTPLDKKGKTDKDRDSKERNTFRGSDGPSRVPFAKVNSQPAPPPPPAFNAAPANSKRDGPVLPTQSSLSSENRPNASMAAPPLRRSSRSSPRKVGRANFPPQTPKGGSNGSSAGVWSNADDSGFVDGYEGMEEEVDGKSSLGSKRKLVLEGGVESPTKVQQRQRQEDAAQVLLGLAGEGR